jgi:hypothetical protein
MAWLLLTWGERQKDTQGEEVGGEKETRDELRERLIEKKILRG